MEIIKHFNTSLGEQLKRMFNPKGGSDFSFFNPVIQPVVKVSPRMFTISGNANNAISSTLLTAPAGKKTFIHAATISVIKDATSTSTVSYLNCTSKGVIRSFIPIAGITLTAQSETLSINFDDPIEIDPSTTVTINNSTNVANINTYASIQYTYEETNNN